MLVAMTDSAHTPLSCPACRVIDAADGLEDGNLFATIGRSLKHENHVVESLKRAQDRVADGITTFAGSLNFVYIHTIWFSIWILLNVGAIGAALVFDKFPFGLLTMIVSLEAIFLSTFVMVSQNRADEKRQVLADHQWQTVQEEDRQNQQLLRLSNQILELTRAIHQMAAAQSASGAHPAGS